MPTTINTPPNESNNDGLGLGLILGVLIIAVILGFVFLIYGIPMLQGGERSGAQDIEIQVPAGTPAPTE